MKKTILATTLLLLETALILLLVLLSPAAKATMTVTLTDDGTGGVIATFEGDGITSGSGDRAIWRDLDGDYTDPDPFLFSFETSLFIAPGITITAIQLDDDGAGPNLDDFAIDFSDIIPSGTAYSIDGSTAVTGLAFSILNSGIYTPAAEQQISFGGATLVIGSVSSIPEPSTLTLFVIGLAGLGFMMRRRRST